MSNRPWVVVEYAGTDDEYIIKAFDSHRDAKRFIEKFYTDADIRQMRVDVMKRLPDCSLTTEF